ncbi:hypothetical protein PFISCL1PPCAC_17938, partial [Pristionchus fissidentatus]
TGKELIELHENIARMPKLGSIKLYIACSASSAKRFINWLYRVDQKLIIEKSKEGVETTVDNAEIFVSFANFCHVIQRRELNDSGER